MLALQSHIVWLANHGFPLRQRTIRALARNLMARVASNRLMDPIRRCWVSRFVKKSSVLSTVFATAINNDRYHYEHDLRACTGWFELYSSTCSKYGITPANTYNIDETRVALSVITHKEKVVAPLLVPYREKKAWLKQPGNREWATAIILASATGQCGRIHLIVKGKTLKPGLLRALDVALTKTDNLEGVIAVSKNGWSNISHAIQWLKVWNEDTMPSLDNDGVRPYRLLILDGYYLHESLEFVEFCDQERIVLLCLPPHATHLLQLLDVAAFGHLKRLYSELVTDGAYTGWRVVNRESFILMFVKAYDESFTVERLTHAFAKTGLLPFNPQVVLNKLAANTQPAIVPEIQVVNYNS